MADTLRERVLATIQEATRCWRICTPESDHHPCRCKQSGDAAIALIRNETLEEAARVADKVVEDNRTTNGKLVVRMAQSASAKSIAAAIRALKDKP